MLTFFGGAGQVTGSNFLLSGHKRLLVDCGMAQGCDFCEEQNFSGFDYDPESIDALLVTHAHIDHIGRIPELVRRGFSGPIYSTEPTRALARPMLEDAVSVMEYEYRDDPDRKPLYDTQAVEAAFERWHTVGYHDAFQPASGYTARFKDAGHILGSAIIEIEKGERTVVFSGDLGNEAAPLQDDTEPVVGANYLVMESVYGDRLHEDVQGRTNKLRRIVKRTASSGGTLLIPAFSLQRTQIMLWELNNMIESGEVEDIPVYLDSPLAIKVTEIYRRFSNNFNKKIRDQIAGGDDIFSFPNLTFTKTRAESKKINDVSGPKIVIAGSGMSHGGRILHHEMRYLPDENSTLLIVGYQSPGSVGRKLLEGMSEVEIFGNKVPVNAHIEAIFGYSAHADRDTLLAFAATAAETAERIFVAMGEPKSSAFLAQRIRDFLGVDAIVPKLGEVFEIEL